MNALPFPINKKKRPAKFVPDEEKYPPIIEDDDSDQTRKNITSATHYSQTEQPSKKLLHELQVTHDSYRALQKLTLGLTIGASLITIAIFHREIWHYIAEHPGISTIAATTLLSAFCITQCQANSCDDNEEDDDTANLYYSGI